MKVRVVAYKESLIMIPSDPTSTAPHWVPTQIGKTGGSVLIDTKRHLEVSEEALHLMDTVKRNRDAIGDLGWWACDDGTHAFSWWGSIHRIVHVPSSEGSRDFKIFREHCTIVPNEVPAGVQLLIDDHGKEVFSWNVPDAVPARGTS